MTTTRLTVLVVMAAAVLALSGCTPDTSEAQHRCDLSRYAMVEIDPYLNGDQKTAKTLEIADQCAREAAEDPAAFNAHWQG